MREQDRLYRQNGPQIMVSEQRSRYRLVQDRLSVLVASFNRVRGSEMDKRLPFEQVESS